MSEVTYGKVNVDGPLELAAVALEAAGYQIIHIPDNDAITGFTIPHNLGGHCEAVVEFLPGVGLLQMTTSLTRGHVSSLLVDNLLKLLNELNLMMPAVTFTFDQDDEEGDEIEISSVCYVFDEIQLEEHVKVMVRYLEEALRYSLPAIYHFVTQKVRVRAETNGDITLVGPSVTIEQVLAMVELSQFGRA